MHTYANLVHGFRYIMTHVLHSGTIKKYSNYDEKDPRSWLRPPPRILVTPVPRLLVTSAMQGTDDCGCACREQGPQILSSNPCHRSRHLPRHCDERGVSNDGCDPSEHIGGTSMLQRTIVWQSQNSTRRPPVDMDDRGRAWVGPDHATARPKLQILSLTHSSRDDAVR